MTTCTQDGRGDVRRARHSLRRARAAPVRLKRQSQEQVTLTVVAGAAPSPLRVRGASSSQQVPEGGRGDRRAGSAAVRGADEGLADEQGEHQQAPPLDVGCVVAELGEKRS